MAKPTRIKPSSVAVLVDGLRVRRIQNISSSSDLSTTDVTQIGDEGIVEVAANTPNVSVTLEANSWGSVDLVASLLNHITNFDDTAADAYNNATTEIMNESELDRIKSDKLGWSTGDPYCAVDLLVPCKEGNSITRTMYLGNCRLNRISLSYDVGGIGKESYTLETDTKMWFLNNLKDYVCLIGKYVSASTFTVVTHKNATVDGADYNAGFTNHLIFVNGINITTDYSASISSWDGSGLVTITGYTLTAGDRIRILAKPDTAGSFPALSDSGFGGVRKGHVEIILKQDSAAEEEALRVQSVTIDVDAGREALQELGNYKDFDRSVKTPIPVTVTVNVLESDLEEYAKLTNKLSTFDAGSLTSMKLEDFVDTITLAVKLYNHQITHIDTGGSATLMQRVIVSGLRTTNESQDNAVGANGTVTFTLKADNFMISGCKDVNPNA